MSRSDRDRDDRGQYAETVTPGDVLALFQNREDQFEPLTAREVADTLDCDRKTAYNKLTALTDREPSALETKKIGARARVWWHSPPIEELVAQAGEQRLGEIANSDVSGESDVAPDPAEGSTTSAAERRRESGADAIDVSDDPETVLTSRGLDDEQRAAVRAMYEYLRERGEADKSDFVNDIYPDHPAGYDSSDGWWNALGLGNTLGSGDDVLGLLSGVEKHSRRPRWRYSEK
jgi:hypothetical protein